MAAVCYNGHPTGSGKNAAAPTSPRLTGLGPTLLPGGGGAAATLRF